MQWRLVAKGRLIQDRQPSTRNCRALMPPGGVGNERRIRDPGISLGLGSARKSSGRDRGVCENSIACSESSGDILRVVQARASTGPELQPGTWQARAGRASPVELCHVCETHQKVPFDSHRPSSGPHKRRREKGDNSSRLLRDPLPIGHSRTAGIHVDGLRGYTW
jgi:hypothetical protein